MTSENTSESISNLKPENADEILDFSDVLGNIDFTTELVENDAPRKYEKYENRYVAYIDILGFSELISKSDKDDSIPSKIYDALDIRHESVEDHFFTLLSSEKSDYPTDFKVHSFSDCVVASSSISPQGLGLLLFFCWNLSRDLLSKNFLSRGGVASGKLLHKVNDGGASMIFGPAFVKAYRLESQIADFPRIVFSKEVREACTLIMSGTTSESTLLRNVAAALSKKFSDGPTGIDLFSHLRAGGLDIGVLNFDVEATQLHQALASHLCDSCDTPHFYKKVHWLVMDFNDAILKTRYEAMKIPC